MTRNIKSLKQDDLPYIIGEVGVNHEGSMDRAKQMIEEIARACGDAVKSQAYKAATLASKHSPAYWDTNQEKTESQYELFKKYDTFDEDDFKELAAHAKQHNIDFIATPFDTESVD
ncbi:MAG TPA: N-acetylneuraminate synthase family protein, partial [Methanobacterium sp.]